MLITNYVLHFSQVTALVNRQLGAAKAAGASVVAVIAVGGFAESPYLLRALRESLTGRVPLVCPPEAGAAVLRGAVAYGLRPDVVVARVARRTIGISSAVPWLDSFEGTKIKRFIHEEKGVPYGNDFFSSFVRKGDAVMTGEAVAHTFFVLYSYLTEVTIEIFASSKLKPMSVCDDGCKKIGTVTVQVPKQSFVGQVRYLEVAFKFGGSSSVCVDVVDKTGGNTANTRISIEYC